MAVSRYQQCRLLCLGPRIPCSQSQGSFSASAQSKMVYFFAFSIVSFAAFLKSAPKRPRLRIEWTTPQREWRKQLRYSCQRQGIGLYYEVTVQRGDLETTQCTEIWVSVGESLHGAFLRFWKNGRDWTYSFALKNKFSVILLLACQFCCCCCCCCCELVHMMSAYSTWIVSSYVLIIFPAEYLILPQCGKSLNTRFWWFKCSACWAEFAFRVCILEIAWRSSW